MQEKNITDVHSLSFDTIDTELIIGKMIAMAKEKGTRVRCEINKVFINVEGEENLKRLVENLKKLTK